MLCLKWDINHITVLSAHSLNAEFATLCASRVFRSTLTSIPQTQSLLNKAKMPLGLLLHPFKDLSVTCQFIIECSF